MVFYKKCKFFCKFFEGQQEKGFYSPECRPEFVKYGGKKSAKGDVKQIAAHSQPQIAHKANIPLAYPEIKLQPGPKQSHHKQKVCQYGVLWTQGAQKVVHSPKASTQTHCPEQPSEGYRRCVHRRSLCQKPGLRGSS